MTIQTKHTQLQPRETMQRIDTSPLTTPEAGWKQQDLKKRDKEKEKARERERKAASGHCCVRLLLAFLLLCPFYQRQPSLLASINVGRQRVPAVAASGLLTNFTAFILLFMRELVHWIYRFIYKFIVILYMCVLFCLEVRWALHETSLLDWMKCTNQLRTRNVCIGDKNYETNESQILCGNMIMMKRTGFWIFSD